jgi:beta-glucosidase/6-phospho-beta-glucosidase/beta-galactosidase
MTEFIFATGIENSYPMTVVQDRNGKTAPLRRDQMRETQHYDRWEEDFALVSQLGLEYLRYGPPYYLIQAPSGACTFSLSPEQLGATKRFDMRERLDALSKLNITPIIDLCHFGLPDWAAGFYDRRWPEKFAQYAATFARTFQDVFLYTPINEIYVAANFSGQLDFWNERANSERGFVAALGNLCRANVLAMEAILDEKSDTVFIQSESSEYFHPETEADIPAAELLNLKRFLSMDLSYGHAVDSEIFRYLMKHGMSETDYDFFMRPPNRRRRDRMLRSCVMGNDYYATNEHWVDGAEHSAQHPDNPNPFHYRESGEIFGYYVITHQYYERYHLPVMHTETNRADRGGDPDEARDWFQKQWANVLRLKQDGVPIVGFTWYGLVDLVGWDDLLRNGNMEPVPAGLCTLDRDVRPVGERYRDFITSWGPRLREPDVEPGPDVTMDSDSQRPDFEAALLGAKTVPAPAVQRAKRAARGVKALHPGLR